MALSAGGLAFVGAENVTATDINPRVCKSAEGIARGEERQVARAASDERWPCWAEQGQFPSVKRLDELECLVV